jgi:hypothetical protein
VAQLFSLGSIERLASIICQLTAHQTKMKSPSIMKTTALLSLTILALNAYAAPPDVQWSGQGTREETMTNSSGVVLTGSDKLVSPDLFRPPVEITIVAKTDSTNLRIGYAADQVIFNWEEKLDQLRVDGGPAGSQRVDDNGQIPKDKFVTIRWLVTPKHQAIYVDGRLCFENCGNYAEVDKPVSVFPASSSVVTVKSITVKQQ